MLCTIKSIEQQQQECDVICLVVGQNKKKGKKSKRRPQIEHEKNQKKKNTISVNQLQTYAHYGVGPDDNKCTVVLAYKVLVLVHILIYV